MSLATCVCWGPSVATSPVSLMPAPVAVLLVNNSRKLVLSGNVTLMFHVSILKLLME